jgi:hypothetical protein
VTSVALPVLARVRRNRAIAPLVDDVRTLLFGGLPLVDLQARERGVFVVEDVAEDDVLGDRVAAVVGDDVVFSAAALTALFEASGRRGPHAVVRGAVRAGTPLWHASARLRGVDTGVDLGVDVVCGAVAGRRAKDVLDDSAIDVVAVADEDGAVDVDVAPAGRAPHVLRLPKVKRLLGQPRHWLHVLDLSLACLASFPRLPRRTKKTFVHPTATVIDSVLGDGVRVEAGASVVDSVIGDDVIVADASVIHTSVIGARCRTLVDTHLRRVVAMPGSTLSNLDMQDAIFGREVFLTTGVAFFADAPGADVVVDGIDSGRPVLSGAIGARAVLGSRALFRCGVAVPPGALIVARPGEALGRLDDKGLEKSLARRGDPRFDV